MKIDHLAYIMADKADIAKLLRLEDEGGIEKAVVMPFEYSPYPRNKEIAELIRGENRLLGSAWVNPRMKNCTEEIEELVKHYGYKDIKLMPTAHYFMPEWDIVHPIMDKAAKLKICVSIHTGTLFAHVYSVRELAETYPDVPIIMEHSGYRHQEPGWGLQQAIRVAKKCNNVHLETAGIFAPSRIRMMVDSVGADKVIFGSEAPVLIPKLCMEVMKLAGLNSKEQALVLGDNLASIYGIK